MSANKELDRLLLTHIEAWQRPTKSDNYVEHVNDTYDAYLAGGGNDDHYKARWLRLQAVYERRTQNQSPRPTTAPG